MEGHFFQATFASQDIYVRSLMLSPIETANKHQHKSKSIDCRLCHKNRIAKISLPNNMPSEKQTAAHWPNSSMNWCFCCCCCCYDCSHAKVFSITFDMNRMCQRQMFHSFVFIETIFSGYWIGDSDAMVVDVCIGRFLFSIVSSVCPVPVILFFILLFIQPRVLATTIELINHPENITTHWFRIRRNMSTKNQTKNPQANRVDFYRSITIMLFLLCVCLLVRQRKAINTKTVQFNFHKFYIKHISRAATHFPHNRWPTIFVFLHLQWKHERRSKNVSHIGPCLTDI